MNRAHPGGRRACAARLPRLIPAGAGSMRWPIFWRTTLLVAWTDVPAAAGTPFFSWPTPDWPWAGPRDRAFYKVSDGCFCPGGVTDDPVMQLPSRRLTWARRSPPRRSGGHGGLPVLTGSPLADGVAALVLDELGHFCRPPSRCGRLRQMTAQEWSTRARFRAGVLAIIDGQHHTSTMRSFVRRAARRAGRTRSSLVSRW